MAITELAQVGFALPLFIQVVDKDEVSPWNIWPIQTRQPSWDVQPWDRHQVSLGFQVPIYKIETNMAEPPPLLCSKDK